MRLKKPVVAGLLFAAGLNALGCSDSPARQITGLSPAADLELQKSGVERQIVTGGVQFMLPEGPGVTTSTTYEMAAIRDRDGRVKGELEIQVDRDPRQKFHGEIVCFLVVGRSAHLAARVTKSNVSFVPPGSYLAWSVVDNGEGNKSAPDQTSNFFMVAQQLATNHCLNGGINPPLFPVSHGDLQVH